MKNHEFYLTAISYKAFIACSISARKKRGSGLVTLYKSFLTPLSRPEVLITYAAYKRLFQFIFNMAGECALCLLPPNCPSNARKIKGCLELLQLKNATCYAGYLEKKRAMVRP